MSQVYRHYRRGESVQALAQRFYQTQIGIHRIIDAMRAAHIMELPLDFIPNEGFAKVRGDKQLLEILGPAPPGEPLPHRA